MGLDWVRQQTKTTHHKMAVFLLPLVIFFGYLQPILFCIGLFIFFIATSFKMLRSMLFWMIILGLISVILPFLAPVIFIIMVVLFFMRIGYVITNWRPFVSGLILYGFSAFLIARSFYFYNYAYQVSGAMVEGLIASVLSFIGLQFMLRWLYRYGYTSYAALGIMGSVPVIIIAFVLPFLKLHVGGDFFASETTIETKPVSGEAYIETKMSTGEAVGSRAPLSSDSLVYVKDHVRTAPDGDPTNNLSYDGPDKKAPNSQLVHVGEHVRTAPDGNPTNNLSYNGETSGHLTNNEVATNSTTEATQPNNKASTSKDVVLAPFLRDSFTQKKEKNTPI
jgi:hypothetical protein